MRRHIATLLIVLGGGAACGCQTTEAWHPTSEHEMRQVIGETVMQAMHQYRDWMIQQTRKRPRDNMPSGPPEKPIV